MARTRININNTCILFYTTTPALCHTRSLFDKEISVQWGGSCYEIECMCVLFIFMRVREQIFQYLAYKCDHRNSMQGIGLCFDDNLILTSSVILLGLEWWK